MKRVKVVAYGTVADEAIEETERLIRNYLSDKVNCEPEDIRWFANQEGLEAKALRVELKEAQERILELEELYEPEEEPEPEGG